MRKSIIYILCLVFVFFISWLGCRFYYNNEMNKLQNAQFILISKQEMKLRLIDYKGNEMFSTGIACGRYPGDKLKTGDMRTPEGIFEITNIHCSDGWVHDFKDGKGEIKGAYGPYFIRLKVPGQNGIGIHGTHDSLSIGQRVTEGCIRLENNALCKLVKMLKIPTVVVITPASIDEKANSINVDKTNESL